MIANEFGGKIETRKCQSCDHFISQFAHQIDRQSHNSGILHAYACRWMCEFGIKEETH